MDNFIIADVISITNSNQPLVFNKPIGNIIDHNWYNLILTRSRQPYFSAISTLSEIIYWFRPKAIDPNNFNSIPLSKFSGDAWQTSYAHFMKKFRFSHETIRRALVKLEELGAIKREFRNIKIKGQIFNNVLFIHLGKNINKFLSPNKVSVPLFSSIICEDPYPHARGYHISNKIKEKESRSNESNFIKSNLEKIKLEGLAVDGDINETKSYEFIGTSSYAYNDKDLSKEISHNIHNITDPNNASQDALVRSNLVDIPTTETIISKASNLIDKVRSRFVSNKRKAIAELFPVTQEEAKSLRISSGRDFNLNYINKLIEKLGEKYPDHGFYTRAKFLEYLKKVLTNELRQESVVNNETFSFRADIETDRMEKYLSQIEDDRSIDKINQLRKKIVAVLDKETAYKLLTSYKFIEERKGDRNKENETQIFQIKVTNQIELSEHQGEILLDQIRAVYGYHIQKIEFKLMKTFTNSENNESKPMRDSLPLNLGKEGTVWNRVSVELLKHYGEQFHRSWFSRLEEVEGNKESISKLLLKAPSQFIGDWIKSNCIRKIEEFLISLGCEVGEVEVTV